MRITTLVLGTLAVGVAAAGVVQWQKTRPANNAAAASDPNYDLVAGLGSSKKGAPQEVSAARHTAAEAVQKKDFALAITVLETARAKFPDQTVLTDDLVVVLQRAAVHRLNEGALAAAARHADRALVLAPDEKPVKKAAVEILRRQAEETDNDERARAYLEEALALDAAHGPTLRALADLCERTNDLACAVTSLTGLSKTDLGHHTRGLDEKIARLSKQLKVEGGFSGVQSDHFVARFEGYGTEQIAWRALNGLERSFFGINEKLGREPGEPITVVIYTGAQYKDALNAPDWSNGLYDGKIRVREGDVQAESGALEDVLAHEYTHALIAQTVRGKLPGWMHEGLAMLHEPNHTPQDRLLKQAAAQGQLLPLDALDAPLSRIQDPTTARLAYQMSDSLIRALQAKQGSFGLTKLLDAIGEGQAFADAFEAVYYLSPDAFYERWKSDQ